jgi:hypothetical protein
MNKILYLPLYIPTFFLFFYIYLNIFRYIYFSYTKIPCTRKKIYYLPLYKAPKLLTPNINSLYKIIIKDELQYISAINREPLHFKIGLCIRYYILDLLDEMFEIVLPLSNHKLNINIHIGFNTKEFNNGTHKIHLAKEKKMDLNEIIQLLLQKFHKLDAKYNILYIHSVHIKIIYGK